MAFDSKNLSVSSADAAAYGLPTAAIANVFTPIRNTYDPKGRTVSFEFENIAANGGALVGRHRLVASVRRPSKLNLASAVTITLSQARVEAGSASASGFTPPARKVHDVLAQLKLVRPPQADDNEMLQIMQSIWIMLHPSFDSLGFRSLLKTQGTL